MARRPALIVVADPVARDLACHDLTNGGYEPLAFADGAAALAWLEEETPSVALIDALDDDDGMALMRVLIERDIEIVLDGAPVAP